MVGHLATEIRLTDLAGQDRSLFLPCGDPPFGVVKAIPVNGYRCLAIAILLFLLSAALIVRSVEAADPIVVPEDLWGRTQSQGDG